MRELVRGVHRSVDHPGSAIQYWDDGEVDDATVVLTHGVTIDHGTFAEQVPALRQAGIASSPGIYVGTAKASRWVKASTCP